MIKLIILDWDDTIIHGSSDAYYACYAAAIQENGIGIDFNTVKHHVQELWGRPHRTVIESIIGASQPQLDNVVKAYEEFLFTDLFSESLSLIPGAKETLLALKSEYTLAIATGMNAVALKERLIPHFRMEDIFSSIISSSQLADPSRGKPYPDMLFKLLEDFSIPADEAVMVGDSKVDVLMAEAAHVLPIAVLTGQLSKEEASGLGLQYILPTIADLPKLLSELK
jgi:phosphoglycolate phosphatase